ncbi:hypothetical protein TWF694_008227 [Orbilia ellipsospora]|uniref:Extracellular membrane protein CFEM domain-containing protein n=1 Tax=Orbilia ellipsospora TaxID=2528407 RepID=A0AAV9XM52_9PEZI
MFANSRSLIAASGILLLASTASAQSVYTPPDSCLAVIDSSQQCGGQDLANNPTNQQYESFWRCFCQDQSLEATVLDCTQNVDPTETVGQSTLRAVQAANAICAQLANVFGSGSGSGTVTGGSQSSAPITTGPQPTDTDLPGSAQCDQLDTSINNCGVASIPDLTVPAMARCICGTDSGSQFSSLVTQCFSYFAVASPSIISSFATFTEGYCNGFGSATTGRGSSPSTPAPTTGSKTSSGPSQTQAGASSGTQSAPAKTSTPGAASTLQIAFGSALFCLFSVVALVL